METDTVVLQNVTKSALSDSLFTLRAMFYLLHPNETYIEKLEEVPNLTNKAGNWFIGLLMIEQTIYLIKDGQFNGRMSDIITSMAGGMIHEFPSFFFRSLNIFLYQYVYDNYLIYELPYDSVWTYIVTFLFIDMMYYWFHRAAHEVNIMWAAHQVHHSAEDYNMSSALRQSIFQKYTSWFFYFPLAFFVRPSIYMVHTHMNLIYQFWIHTELVDNIGPLEYILNTASHHRVHHGRNPYCIDKNYAAVLIIWDRMFGTFAAERKDEELAYGLVHPVGTFDPTYIQVFNYQYIIKKVWNTPSWSEKFQVLFKGPGWTPGSPRTGHFEDLPKIQYPIVKHGRPVSMLLNIYVSVHFFFILVGFGEFIKIFQDYPSVVLSFYIFFMVYSLTCFGKFFDHNKNAIYYDLQRCIICVGVCVNYKEVLLRCLANQEFLFQFFFVLSSVSLAIMTVLSIRNLIKMDEITKDNTKHDINNNEIVKKSKPVKAE